MSEVSINIYGGNNQILPNATQVVQNFYADRLAEEGGAKEGSTAGLFSTYISNEEDAPRYLAMLSACTSAAELARVAMVLLESEPKITEEEVVKKRFIEKLLPLAPKFTRGKGIGNVRARINDALAKRHKKRT